METTAAVSTLVDTLLEAKSMLVKDRTGAITRRGSFVTDRRENNAVIVPITL